MTKFNYKTIAATAVATIVISISLCSCEGRKMSNSQPKGETIEVEIACQDDSAYLETPIIAESSDSIN